ncbi:hypothetical protein FOZ61_007639 [Perkinsus olseni]|uniref:Uncharacterized protein n=1 Tax=Perkinsus olseni TaxID=32597 RepID=A0A7J6L823_PEROL|nr:hypothetical protein FOZ61_007639 [Perkinsus olseni]
MENPIREYDPLDTPDGFLRWSRPISVESVTMDHSVWCGLLTLESDGVWESVRGTINLRIRSGLWLDLTIVDAELRPTPAFTGSSNTKCNFDGVLSTGGIEIKAMSEGVYTLPAFLQSLRNDGCPSSEVPEAAICDASLILRALGYQSSTAHPYPVRVRSFSLPLPPL